MVEILVPTMFKSKDQIYNLCEKLHINSNALFAVQCDKNNEYSFEYSKRMIRVIETTTRGVSINRNILLENCRGDIVLLIDDDCVLADNYVETINKAYDFFNDADVIRFNAISEIPMKKYMKPIKDKRANFFTFSGFGVCGLSLKKSFVLKTGIRFDEKIGVPNYISHGEDSDFLKRVFNYSKKVFQYHEILITILRNDKESSWFKGFDEQYHISTGYVYRKIYGKLDGLFRVKSFFANKNRYSIKFKELMRLYRKGATLYEQQK